MVKTILVNFTKTVLPHSFIYVQFKILQPYSEEFELSYTSKTKLRLYR
jgi:hypothetical protein